MKTSVVKSLLSLRLFMMQYEKTYNVIDRLDKDRMLLNHS